MWTASGRSEPTSGQKSNDSVKHHQCVRTSSATTSTRKSWKMTRPCGMVGCTCRGPILARWGTAFTRSSGISSVRCGSSNRSSSISISSIIIIIISSSTSSVLQTGFLRTGFRSRSSSHPLSVTPRRCGHRPLHRGTIPLCPCSCAPARRASTRLTRSATCPQSGSGQYKLASGRPSRSSEHTATYSRARKSDPGPSVTHAALPASIRAEHVVNYSPTVFYLHSPTVYYLHSPRSTIFTAARSTIFTAPRSTIFEATSPRCSS